MKKLNRKILPRTFLSLLLALTLLAGVVPAALADEIPVPLARELDIALREGSTDLDFTLLRDGHDTTGHTLKRGRSASLETLLPEGVAISSIYVRMDTLPAAVTLRQLNENRKYQTVATMTQPGPEFVLTSDTPVTGQIQLVFDFSTNAAACLEELRFYEEGALPESMHTFTIGGPADILYAVPDAAQVDMALVRGWVDAGRSVQVIGLIPPAENVNLFTDALWDAGVRVCPLWADMKSAGENPSVDQLNKAWTPSILQKFLTNAIRRFKPQLVTWSAAGNAGSVLYSALETAAENAVDYNFDTEGGAPYGEWLVQEVYEADVSDVEDCIANWTDRGDEALRAWCADRFADALSADLTIIPYPAERLEDGYLPSGEEFLYENAQAGLWAYLSETVQVEIVRYEQPEIPRVWFVSDVQFKPESESFHQQLFTAATFPGQMTYPETLAQNAGLVFGINGDYYLYRENTNTTGNILRDRRVLYNYNNKKSMAYPNLDCMALRDDGSMTVYAGSEITADELLAQGDVHDVLSFGPYLVRDGVLRLYAGNSWNATEPRNAIGMVSPGHYKVITVEGRFAKGVGPAGVDLNMLAQLIYAEGVTDALNLDGGSTAVLIFMGEKLNRTASKSGKGETSPRNMSELFGVGTSILVHDDKLHGVE